MKHPEANAAELTDEQLDSVAGGFFGVVEEAVQEQADRVSDVKEAGRRVLDIVLKRMAAQQSALRRLMS